MVAAAVVAAGAISAGVGAYSASQASGAQSAAAGASIAAQQGFYNTTRADLVPFIGAGQDTIAKLEGLTGGNAGGNPLTAPLTAPVVMDQATLEQTPGYQFNLSQGLKAVQNSATSRGLGVSGAAQKGAASYATGLADSTYQNQFNNAVTNQTNTYNRLMGIATLGENAAAQTGAMGTQTGANIGNTLVGSGNAQAAADIAGANSVSGGANSISQAYLLNSLLKGNSGGGMYGINTGFTDQIAPSDL